jgi:hypothetical protein
MLSNRMPAIRSTPARQKYRLRTLGMDPRVRGDDEK